MLGVLLWSATAHAELRPEWEFGLGASAFTLPDYRGSDESRGYVLPFPYVIYRGERVRVDRQGMRGIFFESDRVEVVAVAVGQEGERLGDPLRGVEQPLALRVFAELDQELAHQRFDFSEVRFHGSHLRRRT